MVSQKNQINTIQMVQNAATRILMKLRKYDNDHAYYWNNKEETTLASLPIETKIDF